MSAGRNMIRGDMFDYWLARLMVAGDRLRAHDKSGVFKRLRKYKFGWAIAQLRCACGKERVVGVTSRGYVYADPCVLLVACPFSGCGAKIGQLCQFRGRSAAAPHWKRKRLASAVRRGVSASAFLKQEADAERRKRVRDKAIYGPA